MKPWEDYLATCAELGKEPDETHKGSFNLRIPPELHRQAISQNMSLNDFVRIALDYMVNKQPDIKTF